MLRYCVLLISCHELAKLLGFFSIETFEERPRRIIRDSDFHSDDPVESHRFSLYREPCIRERALCSHLKSPTHPQKSLVLF